MLRLCLLCLSAATLFSSSSVAIPSSVAIASSSSSYPVGDIRNCPITQLMDVLPGFGFDALRSLEAAGQVYHYNFSSCKMSSDGQYLVPNNFQMTPILHSQIDSTDTVYNRYTDWKSETSHSLNVHGHGAEVSWAKINGKFSIDYQKTKSKLVNNKSYAKRISQRHHLYSVSIQPDSQLSPNFKSRVFDIAANIQNNNTENANYLSELMIRDYGTHVITSIDAGAFLSQTTFFTDQSTADKEQLHPSISTSVIASFYSVFNIGKKYKFATTTEETDNFQKQSTSSYTTTHGGPLFKLGNNFSYADWEDGILDHLVTIDHRGEPLYLIITAATIPELPSFLLAQVSKSVYKATAKYYNVNTQVGCTKYIAENFDFNANIDDGSCKVAQQNYTFGGLYQTCENLDDEDVCTKEKGHQKNPLTGSYSCPNEYTPVLLHSGTLQKEYTYSHRMFHYCKWKIIKWIFKRQCLANTSAAYETYWCALGAGEVSQNGLLFGGVYSATVNTGQTTCPEFYFPLHFGEDMEVCVSSDVQASTGYMKFGGFYSCSAGNPMAATKEQFNKGLYPKLCPTHYNQRMISVYEDCIVNFCIENIQILNYQPQPPVLPPFERDFNLFSSSALVLTNTDGDTLVKQSNGEWVKAIKKSATNLTNSSSVLSSSNIGAYLYDKFSNGELAGVIIITVMGTVSVITFIWITAHRVILN